MGELNEAGRAAAETIRASLSDAGLDYTEADPGAFAVNLPGQRRLKTACWLIVGTRGLSIEAFVVRKPDENVAAVHGWLLAHNAKMFGVAWSIDDVGDIYLSGRWPLAAVTAGAIDQVLGSVLEYADSSFNTLLELGFGSSIRREWAWRTSRGESTANLAAFEGYIRRHEPDGEQDG
ncbi:YbjN domain-containing protein [Jatrophihabitans telluris]|uniref:YbjN domain-containing protein n=1 Tax=Jatrophihabitans telluris TaxID=2038343 RepID=A0ABY4QZC8_9ACTN|nr:YbjN domain-containing protein [Jatrophihabitans telluris]UQX88855.1 YbjN domain-containing protein [Jatrophihabitans telluris]